MLDFKGGAEPPSSQLTTDYTQSPRVPPTHLAGQNVRFMRRAAVRTVTGRIRSALTPGRRARLWTHGGGSRRQSQAAASRRCSRSLASAARPADRRHSLCSVDDEATVSSDGRRSTSWRLGCSVEATGGGRARQRGHAPRFTALGTGRAGREWAGPSRSRLPTRPSGGRLGPRDSDPGHLRPQGYCDSGPRSRKSESAARRPGPDIAHSSSHSGDFVVCARPTRLMLRLLSSYWGPRRGVGPVGP